MSLRAIISSHQRVSPARWLARDECGVRTRPGENRRAVLIHGMHIRTCHRSGMIPRATLNHDQLQSIGMRHYLGGNCKVPLVGPRGRGPPQSNIRRRRLSRSQSAATIWAFVQTTDHASKLSCLDDIGETSIVDVLFRDTVSNQSRLVVPLDFQERGSAMRPNASMTRTLFLFIVLRMVAAPVALRPDTPKTAINHGFIVRMCAWPAHRPGRTNTAEHLVSRRRGNDQNAPAYRARQPWIYASSPSILAHLSLHARRNRLTVHLSDCPRC